MSARVNRASVNRASAGRASTGRASAGRASVNRASTDGASVNRASTDRASVNRASTDRASVNRASTDGASVNRASTGRASTDGASVNRASTDGASVNRASTGRASVNRASAGRASVNRASTDGASTGRASVNRASTNRASTAQVASVGELRAIGLAGGLEALGVASAEPFADTLTDLHERRDHGLHGGMAFTYRNPERSTDPGRIVAGARSLLVGSLRYDPPSPQAPAGEPTAGPLGRVAAYATRDHYARLRAALEAVAERLRVDGWTARVVADDNALVDRAAAHRAGIGWYGKSSNLLAPGRGSWFVLGSVVTDAELPTDEPIADGCGSCTRCITGCPTGAIVAPGVVDARRCLAWLVQATGTFPRRFRVALGDRLYGCDECQVVCPPNRRGSGAAAVEIGGGRPEGPDDTGDDREEFVAVLDLLEAPDADLLDRFGRWYIPRRDPRYLRRNALVVLGNVGSDGDERTGRVLARYLGGDDPLLAAHAVWAARRLGLHPLVALADPSAPEVAAELTADAGVDAGANAVADAGADAGAEAP